MPSTKEIGQKEIKRRLARVKSALNGDGDHDVQVGPCPEVEPGPKKKKKKGATEKLLDDIRGRRKRSKWGTRSLQIN